MMRSNATRHLSRWLFYCLLPVLGLAPGVQAQGPAMTTVADTVYRANGQPASGTIVVSWPAFNTADHKPVAAGELSVVIGAQGAVSLSLAPNEGADPGGTFYKAIYKLADGTTFTEYWVVPAASPATITAIRASVVPRQVGAQFVSRQYVDSAVAITQQQMVHKTGSESIDGVKSFLASPEVPAPATGAAAVNKDYVAAAITALSDGFVDRSGDTMFGPLTLPNDPTAPGHATNRLYVDQRVSDMQAGLVYKLSRFGDTPFDLAGVRYATQFSQPGAAVQFKVAAACADLGGNQGTVVVPSPMETGDVVPFVPGRCTVEDRRGTGGFNYGGYTTNNTKGITWYERFNDANIPPNTFALMYSMAEAAAGGVNAAGSKSNYFNADFEMLNRTPGQHTTLTARQNHATSGDAVALAGNVNTSGGTVFGIGDEGAVAARLDVTQDNAIFTSTITAINGNVITYAAPSPTYLHQFLGEQRFLINTSAGVYSTGTSTTAPSSATITEGGGADYEAATASGVLDSNSNPRFGFALDYDAGNPNNNASASSTLKYVAPIVAVAAGGTTATLRNGWPATVTGSTNTYKIYQGSIVLGVDSPNNKLTVSDASQFAVGNAIELPLDTRLNTTVIKALGHHRIGRSANSSAIMLSLSNSSADARGKFDRGIEVLGNFSRLMEFGGHTFAPTYARIYNGGTYNGTIFDYINSTTDNDLLILNLINRNAATAGTASSEYAKSGERWRWKSTNVGEIFSMSSTAVSSAFGAAPVAGTALTITPAGADKGLVIKGNTTGNVLEAQAGSVPRFMVSGTQAQFNNAVDVKGYAGDQSAQKWQITGSSGRANFNGGVCQDDAQTICDTAGSGAPTGACVTGSTYRRTDGGSATTLYVCESSAWSAAGGGGGSANWSTLGNPAAAQSLSMGANTSTWTWNSATGSATDLLRLTDSAGNTGTGHLVSIETGSSSALKPFQVKPRGTVGFEVNEFGVVSVLAGVTTSSGLTIQSGGSLMLKGRDDWFSPVTVSGSDFTGSTATAGSTTLRSGDANSATGSTTGGNLLVRSGGVASASGTPGVLQMAQTFLKDTSVTSGYLQCFKAAAAMTVGDCGNSATNSVGVAISASNTNPVIVQFQGIATLQFDATASPSAGWFACSSTSQGGKVAVQSGACAAGRQVGIVAQNGTSITSGKVFLQAR